MRILTQGLSIAALMIGAGQVAAQDDPVAEYDSLLREISELQAYNELLQRQIATQQRQISELQNSIGGVPDLERLVPPLIERMVDGLEEFVELDVPFLIEERKERVAELRQLMARADVSTSEKYRQIMSAYQIENEYGRTIEAYQAELAGDERGRTVSFLRIGRVALIYETLDGQEIGAWDASQRAFVPLGAEHRNSIRHAIRMAANTVAPDLVLVPIPAPE